jgi:dihydrofolate reductase
LGGFLALEQDRAVCRFINAVQKFVVTSSPPDELWTNTTVVDRDLAGFVKDLKQQPGADIGVHGSILLTQQLLQHGLVDELRLVIAPAVQIRGRKLFEDVPPTRLTLTRSVSLTVRLRAARLPRR